MNIQQYWYYVGTFGLLEGENAGEWLQSSVNNKVLLFIYLYGRSAAQAKVHLYPQHLHMIIIQVIKD
jgi:hypothetical protein